jgi:hypothetical protein
MPYIDKLFSLGWVPQWIRVIGGEPFLHSDLKGFILGVRKHKPKIAVTTNGFWLNEIEKFRDVLPVIDDLHISIYPDMELANWRQQVEKVRKVFHGVFRVTVEEMYSMEYSSIPQKLPLECHHLLCPCLRPDGKIYRCSSAAYATEWNPYVTGEFVKTAGSLVLDLSRDIGAKELHEWVNSERFEACRYCNLPERESKRAKVRSDFRFFQEVRRQIRTEQRILSCTSLKCCTEGAKNG